MMTLFLRSTTGFKLLINSSFLSSLTPRLQSSATCLTRQVCCLSSSESWSLLTPLSPVGHQFSRSLCTSSILFQNLRKQKVRNNAKEADSRHPGVKVKETVAYCAAESYNLPMVRYGLSKLLGEFNLPEIDDAISYNYKSGQAYIFSQGIVVFWDVSPADQSQFINQLASYAENPFHRSKASSAEELSSILETDTLSYVVAFNEQNSRINRKGLITLSSSAPSLEQYAFSNALALSVKLASWESSLDLFSESIRSIAQEMREGRTIKMKRTAVFQKIGELFTLRSNLNLESDLLGPPDFYWDREDLEILFQNTCSFLALRSRTNLMNEKLTYCYELLQQLTSHMDQEHNTKLEWMIIILITVEVLFEVIHFLDKYSVN